MCWAAVIRTGMHSKIRELKLCCMGVVMNNDNFVQISCFNYIVYIGLSEFKCSSRPSFRNRAVDTILH